MVKLPTLSHVFVVKLGPKMVVSQRDLRCFNMFLNDLCAFEDSGP